MRKDQRDKGLRITQTSIAPFGGPTVQECYEILYHGIGAIAEYQVNTFAKEHKLDPTDTKATAPIRAMVHDDIVLSISYLLNRLYPEGSAVETTEDTSDSPVKKLNLAQLMKRLGITLEEPIPGDPLCQHYTLINKEAGKAFMLDKESGEKIKELWYDPNKQEQA